jgi:DnaK suppressor protein
MMLTPAFIEARKKDLLREKAELAKEIKPLEMEEYGESEEDAAQKTADTETSVSERENVAQLLVNVNKALEKIEQGTYGTCEKGSELIEEERLKAFPAATVCIRHQKELEQKKMGPRWFRPWTWRR